MGQNGTALFYDRAAVAVYVCVCACIDVWVHVCACMCMFSVILLQIGNKMVALVK